MTEFPQGTRQPRIRYHKLAGVLLFISGILHLFFSVMGILVIWNDPALRGAFREGLIPLLSIGNTYLAPFNAWIVGYGLVQVLSGWLLGILSLIIGWFALEGKLQKWVTGVIWVNLFYFPIGTVISAVVLMGRRPVGWKS